MSDDRKKWPAAQDDQESEDVEAHVKTRNAAAAAANDEGDDGGDDVEAHVKTR
jgi:hypothetical protein